MIASRRRFLKTGMLATAGTLLTANQLLAFKKQGITVGLQLYSVRDEMKTAPLQTLQQLAAMGYTHVEHANYVDGKLYGYEPAAFKKLLNNLGLTMPSGHTVMGKTHWDASKKQFTDLWKQTVEDAAILGQEYVISPWLDASLRTTYDDLVRYMEVFNKSGELCKQHGMMFGYHNHDFEFSEKLNGQTVFDIILKNTDPSLVMQQLDMGNLYNGGAIAADVLKQYPGRFASLHVKDEIAAAAGSHETYESTVLGKGIVNVKALLNFVTKTGGTKYFIVEQEAYQGQRPMEAMRDNLAVMKKWGYV